MGQRYYPKISIVTVCFNSAKTIEQTILSVINQTYKNIEYIIIDGKSTDGTVDIIRKYQDKIACFVSEPDGGIYDAMNKGIEQASGDYIYFIGSDDYLVEENIISAVADYLKEDKTIDILSGGVWVVDEEYGLKKRFNPKPSVLGILSGDVIITPPHQGMFVKTKLMKQNHFNIEYKIVADSNFFIECVRSEFHVKYIDDLVAYFSNQGVSYLSGISCQLENKRKVLTNGLLEKNYYGFYKNFFIEIIKFIIRTFVRKIRVWKLMAIKNGWQKN